MRFITLTCVAVAGIALLAHTTSSENSAVGVLAIVLSGLWVWMELRGTAMPSGFLAAFALLACLSAVQENGLALPALSITAALYAWDTSLARARLAGFPPTDKRPIVVRYAATAGILALASLGLIAVTTTIRVTLGFGISLGLAAALLVVGVLVARLARLPHTRPTDSPPDALQHNEEAGREVSPGSDTA